MNLPSLDNLFTTQEERDNPKILKIGDLSIDLIHDFPNHPFKITDNEEMYDMVESVSKRVVIMPAIVRKESNDNYTMIAGHRRKHAAKLAGLKRIPCIIMNLTDDEATILMVDTNINQRRKMLLSEKAFTYKMKLDAIKHQGKKEDETSRLIGEKLKKIFSADIIGKEVGESARTIQRYVRLTYLIPELLELVDKETNGMGLYPAVEISYISQENQKLIYESFKYNDATASMSQAKQLRKLNESNKLTNKKIIEIMQQQKPNQREQFKTSYDNIRKFFPNNYTNAQIDKKILELLELYYKQWNQQV
jgi:hypothetical protein